MSVSTPQRTPNNNYRRRPDWCKGILVAAGNKKYHVKSLCQFIKAAAKDGIDLQSMRPEDLSKEEKDKRDQAWKRTYYTKLLEGGEELTDLVLSASYVLDAATLRAHGIRTLRRTDRAQSVQNMITLFFAMAALFLGAKQCWNV